MGAYRAWENMPMPLPKEIFSKRLGLRPETQEVGPNEVPDAVRVKLIPLIDGYRGNGLAGATTLGVNLYEAIGKISPQATGLPMPIRAWREMSEPVSASLRLADVPLLFRCRRCTELAGNQHQTCCVESSRFVPGASQRVLLLSGAQRLALIVDLRQPPGCLIAG